METLIISYPGGVTVPCFVWYGLRLLNLSGAVSIEYS